MALTRAVAGSTEPHIGPAQEISREEAFAMWTRDAAKLLRWDDIGSLATGNHADIAILDRLPESVTRRLVDALQTVMRDKALQDRLQAQGFDLRLTLRGDFAERIRSDHALWGRVVKNAKIISN